jgi:glyoxylase-like metal-dependent hydrolase (beta-lactamase superfamily II)
MKKIAACVHIENAYPGVTIGAVSMDDGLLMIDAPLHPDDGREWLHALRKLNDTSDRMLVYLDAHTDRTLGGQVLESPIIAHQSVFRKFENRSAIFKAQILESGDTWETCTGLSGIRWASPSVAFSQETRLHWGESEIILEHHPGPDDGAIWVIVPEAKVAFIGDLVTQSQPPFLSQADLPTWENSLDLLAKKYPDFKKVSSRDGVIDEDDIKAMKKFISGIHKQLDRLNRRKAQPQDTEKLVEKQIASFDFAPRYRNHYFQRLKYGLMQCFARQYLEMEDLSNL